jgi:hypothetical protein
LSNSITPGAPSTGVTAHSASKEIAGEGPATGREIQHDSARGRSDTPHCRPREAGLL